MKIRCHRPTLAAAFQVVSGVVPSRTPKEILKNVKLVFGDRSLSKDHAAVLIGTDQEIGIRYEIADVESDTAGEVLLPTARFASILREVHDDQIVIEVMEDSICIQAGQSEFRLGVIDPAEFPAVAGFDDVDYVSVPANDLKQMIRRTVFATDVESHRYALGGVLLDRQGESLTMAATDSRRLAVVRSACTVHGVSDTKNTEPVVPSKALTLVERSLSEDSDDALIAVHANDVVIKCGNSTIYSRLVEGKFPRYRDVIPQDSPISIELVTTQFYSAIRQSQIVTSDESRGVDFSFSEGLLTLNSRSPEVGQSKIEMPISFTGESLTITFDPRYVAEFLRVLDAEVQLEMQLTDSESAVVFRAGDDCTYVVMPLSQDR
ncbi:MAG: DNA polymerase III subunit beta [Planctomycetaceae bacterium]